MEEILDELIQTVKWLPSSFKNSNYYNEYLNKVLTDLKNTKL